MAEAAVQADSPSALPPPELAAPRRMEAGLISSRLSPAFSGISPAALRCAWPAAAQMVGAKAGRRP